MCCLELGLCCCPWRPSTRKTEEKSVRYIQWIRGLLDPCPVISASGCAAVLPMLIRRKYISYHVMVPDINPWMESAAPRGCVHVFVVGAHVFCGFCASVLGVYFSPSAVRSREKALLSSAPSYYSAESPPFTVFLYSIVRAFIDRYCGVCLHVRPYIRMLITLACAPASPCTFCARAFPCFGISCALVRFS